VALSDLTADERLVAAMKIMMKQLPAKVSNTLR
jgi:hypothetical protein